jgi:hypothetical protein
MCLSLRYQYTMWSCYSVAHRLCRPTGCVVQNRPLALNQTTEAWYANPVSRSVAKGLDLTIVATRLMTSRLIGDVACQAFWHTAQRYGDLSMTGSLIMPGEVSHGRVVRLRLGTWWQPYRYGAWVSAWRMTRG